MLVWEEERRRRVPTHVGFCNGSNPWPTHHGRVFCVDVLIWYLAREHHIWAWKRQELQNDNNNNNRYCLEHHLQCKGTKALRDPSWIFFCSMIFMLWDTFSPTSWINFLCLPESRMSIFFFCFLDRIYCTSSEQRFDCWKSKVLFCNGVSPHLLWIAEQQLLGCASICTTFSFMYQKAYCRSFRLVEFTILLLEY